MRTAIILVLLWFVSMGQAVAGNKPIMCTDLCCGLIVSDAEGNQKQLTSCDYYRLSSIGGYVGIQPGYAVDGDDDHVLPRANPANKPKRLTRDCEPTK